jgi:hypothetical protein
MYIVVHHHLTNPARFWEIVAAWGTIPPGITLHQSLPARDDANIFCLWEADSIQAVREILDPPLENVARNEYFEVDASRATGLPAANRTAEAAAG